MFTIKKWIFPLLFFQSYLTSTVLLYLYGPWPWNERNQTDVVIYLVLSQLFIAFGYSLSLPFVKLFGFRENISCSTNKFINFSIFIGLIIIIPTNISRNGSFFPDIFSAIMNPGEVYNQTVDRYTSDGTLTSVEYFRIVFSLWLVSLYPLTLVYYNQLSTIQKLFSILSIIFTLATSVAIGINKGIYDFLITFPWLLWVYCMRNKIVININFKKITIFVFIFCFVLYFFGMGQTQREGGVGILGALDTGYDGLITTSRNGEIYNYVPNFIVVIYESITRYLTQGYYAFSLGYNLEYDNTYGLANSMFISRNVDAITGSNYFTTNSLPTLIELNFNWSSVGLWHSIYSWYITDFGYVGTLILMAIFGFLLGLSWIMQLVNGSFLYTILFYYMLLLFYYIPANNQIMQSGEYVIGFLCLLCVLAIKNLVPQKSHR